MAKSRSTLVFMNFRQSLYKSILFSLGFNSNFYFHFSELEYGTPDGLLKPFLHTWSLSVEEQYYILFPIILLITFQYFRKYIIHVFIFGFVLSLGLADWGSTHHHFFNFCFQLNPVFSPYLNQYFKHTIINFHHDISIIIVIIIPMVF